MLKPPGLNMPAARIDAEVRASDTGPVSLALSWKSVAAELRIRLVEWLYELLWTGRVCEVCASELEGDLSCRLDVRVRTDSHAGDAVQRW